MLVTWGVLKTFLMASKMRLLPLAWSAIWLIRVDEWGALLIRGSLSLLLFYLSPTVFLLVRFQLSYYVSSCLLPTL